MTTLRQLCLDDLLKFNLINLDVLTETYNGTDQVAVQSLSLVPHGSGLPAFLYVDASVPPLACLLDQRKHVLRSLTIFPLLRIFPPLLSSSLFGFLGGRRRRRNSKQTHSIALCSATTGAFYMSYLSKWPDSFVGTFRSSYYVL